MVEGDDPQFCIQDMALNRTYDEPRTLVGNHLRSMDKTGVMLCTIITFIGLAISDWQAFENSILNVYISG
jgi:hypothetical protein